MKLLCSRAAIVVAVVAAFATHAHASYPAVRNDHGDLAVLDPSRRLHVFSDGQWLQAGLRSDGLAGGIAAVQTSDDDRGFFVTAFDGHLHQYARQPGGWGWIDHGTPPCGRSFGAPSAVGSGGVVRVMVRCEDGRLAERSRSGGVWAWTDHGAPPGTTLRSDPALVSATGYTGAVMLGADGNVWERYAHAFGWSWANHGNPGPVHGHPGFVRNPHTGYTGAILVGNEGVLVEDYYDYGAGRWRFAYHSVRTTAGAWCMPEMGPAVQPSFTTRTDDASVMAVVRCTVPSHAQRLTYDPARGWVADLVPSPLGTFERNPSVRVSGASFRIDAPHYPLQGGPRQLYAIVWDPRTGQFGWTPGPTL